MPGEVEAHVNCCAACLLSWQHEQELTAELALLRARIAGSEASPAVRSAVVAALPNRTRTLAVLALAAAILITFAATWYVKSQRPAEPPAARQPLYTDFFPLTTVALDRHEPAQVVRIRLPRREMRRFGLPVSEELERSPVEADVVIGQDGIARAVRFVSVSHH
jgi:hypothetical protein